MNIDIGGDTLVEWERMRNEETSEYVNNATVTGYLKTVANVEIVDFEMPYISDSKGTYVGTIPAATTATLTNGTKYLIEIIATGSVTGLRREYFRAAYRGQG